MSASQEEVLSFILLPLQAIDQPYFNNNKNNNNTNKITNIYRGRPQSLESAFNEGPLFN